MSRPNATTSATRFWLTGPDGTLTACLADELRLRLSCGELGPDTLVHVEGGLGWRPVAIALEQMVGPPDLPGPTATSRPVPERPGAEPVCRRRIIVKPLAYYLPRWARLFVQAVFLVLFFGCGIPLIISVWWNAIEIWIDRLFGS
jgi:hypothetical protein